MKSFKVSCPSCGQRVEAPKELGSQVIPCPTCGYNFSPGEVYAAKTARLKPLTVFVAVTVGAVVAFVLWQWKTGELAYPSKTESKADRLERFHREAQDGLKAECTNVVTGYFRTIRTRIQDEGENPALWTAEATVEFINQVGGIERTNLPFIFRQWAHGNVPRVVCRFDEEKLRKEQEEKINEMIRRLSR